ncbi:MAG: putative N-acetylmannosamine-6-phosphate 2-epimerase [Fimbriimonadaceae bacterium]|nr:putative N-acetylmannosamine-6-phosphate 2-epimerase [Fimbriimonadaceae bacterium]
MTTENFVALLTKCPLIASVQAPPGAPLDHPDTIRRFAQSSTQEGVGVLRVQGVSDIEACHTLGVPIVGLIKRDCEGSEVRITPTAREVSELLASPVEVIALDATTRPRPGGNQLPDLIRQIHQGGRLAWADCDGVESAQFALESGADLLSTTLCGYTSNSQASEPDLDALQQMVNLGSAPVIAEGRFQEAWQVRSALQIGAVGVVIGGALNDPLKQTARFVKAATTPKRVLGFDIGGTWLRCGRFENWRLVESERIPLPADPAVRHKWMRDRAGSDVERIGISSGGTIDPLSRTVTEAKPIIPHHVGMVLRFGPKPTYALNDGLATAYGHSCLPQCAGRRTATLALGTGVGFGLVDRGSPWMGPHGEYPRLNDVDLGGRTFEDLLGGASLSPSGQEPSEDAKRDACVAAHQAVDLIRGLFMPDEIILAGAVGLAAWLDFDLPRSPFGANAGLYGAAALAIWPPFD